MLDVLLSYVENKNAKDQFYLLILESRCIEILYALLLEKIFTTELREKVIKVRTYYYHDCERAITDRYHYICNSCL